MTSTSSEPGRRSNATLRRLRPLSVLILGLVLGSCTVEDDIVTEIGVTDLILVDSDLTTQTVSASPADHTIQVVEWSVTRADLTVGSQQVDLTFSENCEFQDTALVVSVGTGACAGGLVVDADDEVRPVTLELTFTMGVRRAPPIDLPPAADFDGDGVANASDNCPLIDNPDQTDTRNKGFGDACSIRDIVTGADRRDSDGDRVADVVDNCPHVINPEQLDTMGLGEAGILDGIGDACEPEQVGSVRTAGQTEIQISLGPVDLLQPLNQITFLTVDFGGAGSLTCNWGAETCELDPAQVRFCVSASPFGCP